MILRAIPVLAASLSVPSALPPAKAPARASHAATSVAAPSLTLAIPVAAEQAPVPAAPAGKVSPGEAAQKVLDLVDKYAAAVRVLYLETETVISVELPNARLRELAFAANAVPSEMDGYPVRVRRSPL